MSQPLQPLSKEERDGLQARIDPKSTDYNSRDQSLRRALATIDKLEQRAEAAEKESRIHNTAVAAAAVDILHLEQRQQKLVEALKGIPCDCREAYPKRHSRDMYLQFVCGRCKALREIGEQEKAG